MANPQVENGHVRIANEILDELSRITLSSREWNLMIFVIRKTWGWNKKSDHIPLSQFRKGCLLNQSQVCRILKNLVSRKILAKDENGYRFNKNYEEWVVSPKTPLVSPVSSITEDTGVVSPASILPVSPVILSKDIIKNTIHISSRPVLKKPEAKQKKFFNISSKEFLLGVHLFEAIRFNNPGFKVPNLQNWAGEIDKMLRIDSRSPEGIDYLIHWSQKDKFWFKNILSPGTLREKFDRLVVEAKSDFEKAKAEAHKKKLQNLKF